MPGVFGPKLRTGMNLQINLGFSEKSIHRIVVYCGVLAVSEIKEAETASGAYIFTLTSEFTSTAHNFCFVQQTIFHTIMVCHP